MQAHEALRAATSADAKTFWKKGYVVLKQALRPNTVEQLRSAMSEAVRTFKTSPSSYDLTSIADAIWADATLGEDGSTLHDLEAFRDAVKGAGLPRLIDKASGDAKRGRFLVDSSVWRRVPQLEEIALDGALPQIAATLLDKDLVRYYDDQIFIKEPGTEDRAAFHQDLPYFHLDGDCGCVMWIPLDEVRKGTGSLAYIPGSHCWGSFNANMFMSRAPFPGSEGLDLPDIESNPEKFGAEYIEADPGDVVVHHFLTVHGSEGNLGKNNRRAFSLRYCDANIRYLRKPGAPEQLLHKRNMKDGDALDDGIHPIVWPPRNQKQSRAA